MPSFRVHPERAYFADDDGYYLSEASYGRFGRTAKALGYRLFAYEDVRPPSPKATLVEQIATREEAQATTLAAYLAAHPRVRLLVHAGYSHAAEVPQAQGARWMAARLKEETGIDPLTISQTTCRGGGAATRLAVLPAAQPAGTFDLVVDHPTARFVHGRPEWRQAAGDQIVAIPPELRPKHGWRVIEARPVGEPELSVPMDRVAIRPGEDIALLLPPGRYALRVIDVGVSAKTPAQYDVTNSDKPLVEQDCREANPKKTPRHIVTMMARRYQQPSQPVFRLCDLKLRRSSKQNLWRAANHQSREIDAPMLVRLKTE